MKFKVILNLSLVLLMLGVMSTRALAAIASPVLTTPADNAKNLLFNVELKWNSATSASYYAIQVSTDVTFTDPDDQLVNEAKIEALKFDLTGLTYGKNYFWRLRSVRAEGGDYQESLWSTAFKLTTIPAINIVGQMEVCNDIDNIKQYTVDAIPGVVYTWTVTGGTIISDGSPTDNSINVQWTTSSGTGNIKVVRTASAWGTFTDNGNINVTVKPVHKLTITTETDTYYDGKYCPNERIKFTASISDATFDESDFVEYYWEFGVAGGGKVKVSDVMSTVQIWPTVGTYHVKFFARTTPGDCANYTKEFDVEVVNTCAVTPILDVDQSICQGTSGAKLNMYVFGGAGGDLVADYTYKWTPKASFLNPTEKDGIYLPTTVSKYVDFYATDSDGKTGHLNFKVLLRPRPVPTIVSVLTVPVSVDKLSFTDGDAGGNYILLKDYGCTDCTGWTWEWLDKDYNPTIDPDVVPIAKGINTFYLTVTNDQGCDSKLFRGVIYRARSKEIMEHDYTVGANATAVLFAYPNPVVNNLNVFAEFEKEANITCSIINMEGKVIKTFNSFGKIYDTNLDVNDLPVGTYILSVETNDDAVVWKFNKN
ncbi:MAG: T9SS type A sorting domain-containing protein [bacterium]